jgi:hypothetical protein
VIETWAFEIPSVEHPVLLRAALDEAAARQVRIRRVSMGSGLQYLTAAELEDYLSVAHAHEVDVFLYTSSRNTFEPLAEPGAGEQLCGETAFAHGVSELRRCARLGVDGVLIADIGLLAIAGELRERGELGTLGLKTAAALAPRNAASSAVLDRLGATSINVSSATGRDDLLAIRAAISPATTIDIYVEAPADLGGGVRYRDVPWFVNQLAPVYLKIGIRNMAPLYPYGMHLEPGAEQSIREKVRRAQLVLAELERQNEPTIEGGR